MENGLPAIKNLKKYILRTAIFKVVGAEGVIYNRLLRGYGSMPIFK